MAGSGRVCCGDLVAPADAMVDIDAAVFATMRLMLSRCYFTWAALLLWLLLPSAIVVVLLLLYAVVVVAVVVVIVVVVIVVVVVVA